MALVVVDMPIRVDGLNLAFLGAQLAGVAALLAALEPVEQAHPAGHRQRRTERAHVAAEHLARSEEHTSELQSRPHLVCRLLLEKKKAAQTRITARMATAP